jgi:hypothetical protein
LDARPAKLAVLQPLVTHMGMQALRLQRRSWSRSHTRFIHYSGGGCHVSAGDTIGTVNGCCCRRRMAPYGRFRRPGRILRIQIRRSSWVVGEPSCAQST